MVYCSIIVARHIYYLSIISCMIEDSLSFVLKILGEFILRSSIKKVLRASPKVLYIFSQTCCLSIPQIDMGSQKKSISNSSLFLLKKRNCDARNLVLPRILSPRVCFSARRRLQPAVRRPSLTGITTCHCPSLVALTTCRSNRWNDFDLN